jgi:Cytochrome P460/Putative zinc-finger
MKCAYSKEILALYVEDDLPTLDSIDKVEAHVAACADCRQYCVELRTSQSLIKSGFHSTNHQTVSQEMLATMRRSVMSQINTVQQSLGWSVRLERLLMSGLRTHRYAIAGLAVVAIISASLLAQIRHSGSRSQIGAAVFVGNDTLLCPSSYREWVFVGCSLGKAVGSGHSADMYHNVYIDPDAYREYSHSGKFPDGTVMVLEVFSADAKREPELEGTYEKDPIALQVSVRDSSRFDEGWGFFDFTEGFGKLKTEAKPLPETAGCLACHRDKAATDHVFSQFYPVLRASTAKL